MKLPVSSDGRFLLDFQAELVPGWSLPIVGFRLVKSDGTIIRKVLFTFGETRSLNGRGVYPWVSADIQSALLRVVRDRRPIDCFGGKADPSRMELEALIREARRDALLRHLSAAVQMNRDVVGPDDLLDIGHGMVVREVMGS